MKVFDSILSEDAVPVALSIGSNSGDRGWYIGQMELHLRCLFGAEVNVSSLMETAPVEVTSGHPWYLNRIIGSTYAGTPADLLEACCSIERQLGRTGKGLRTARTADIDVLLFGQRSVATEELIIPHPGILRRRFCLEGLVQIMPDAMIAGTGKTVCEHYANMTPSVKSQRMRFVVPQGENHGD